MMKTVVLSNDKIHTGTLLLVNARCPMKYENKKGLLPANINFPDIRLDRDAANALQFVLEKISANFFVSKYYLSHKFEPIPKV